MHYLYARAFANCALEKKTDISARLCRRTFVFFELCVVLGYNLHRAATSATYLKPFSFAVAFYCCRLRESFPGEVSVAYWGLQSIASYAQILHS